MFGIIAISLVGWRSFPLPENSARDFFEKKYQEVAANRYFDALETLQCSPSGSHSAFTKKTAYLCRIDTPCEISVEQRIFVDWMFGPHVGPDPFYQRFARAYIEILNIETAQKAAARIDQGG